MAHKSSQAYDEISNSPCVSPGRVLHILRQSPPRRRGTKAPVSVDRTGNSPLSCTADSGGMGAGKSCCCWVERRHFTNRWWRGLGRGLKPQQARIGNVMSIHPPLNFGSRSWCVGPVPANHLVRAACHPSLGRRSFWRPG